MEVMRRDGGIVKIMPEPTDTIEHIASYTYVTAEDLCNALKNYIDDIDRKLLEMIKED